MANLNCSYFLLIHCVYRYNHLYIHSPRLIATIPILQLCSTKSGRKYIKENNAYVIIRELHKWESDENVIKVIENLVQILIGDEPVDNMANLLEVHVPDEINAQLDKLDEKNN